MTDQHFSARLIVKENSIYNQSKLDYILRGLLAVCVSVWLCWHNPNIGGDALAYIFPVQNLMSGKGYTMGGMVNILNSPGYGFAVWLVDLVIHDLEYAAMAVSGLSYLALVSMAGWLGDRFSGRFGGWLAGLFVALSPMAMTHSYLSLADPLFAAMLMICFCHFVVSDTAGWDISRCLVQGGLLGLACLVRPDTVIVLPLVTGWIGVRCWTIFRVSSTGGSSAVMVAWQPFSVLGMFLLVVLPYMIFLHSHTGIWTVSNKIGFALLGGGEQNPHLTLELARGAAGYLLANLGNTLHKCAVHLFLLAHKTLLQNLGPLFAVGLLWIVYLVLGRRPIRSLRQWPQLLRLLGVGALFLAPLGPSLLILPYSRYVLPYYMISLVLLAAVASLLISGIWNDGGRGRALGVFITLAFMILAPLVPRPAAVGEIPSLVSVVHSKNAHQGLREAGYRLAAEPGVERGFVIHSRKGTVPLFYAAGKREPIGIPFGLPATPEEFPAIFKNRHVDYVILDSGYVPQMPAYSELWANPQSSSLFDLEWIDGKDDSYQLYRPHITAQSRLE